MTIALIIAGGSGNRMGQDIPKQFLHIDNCPVIVKTLLAFQQHPGIDKIAVVCLSGWEMVLRSYANQFMINKLEYIFPGGENGQTSIRNGVFGLLEKGCVESDVILIHDAVRPLVSQNIISNNIATCTQKGNAITVVKCVEAILESEDSFSSNITIPRDRLFRTQTPQTFYLGELVCAHKEALVKGINSSVSSATMMIELEKNKMLYMVLGEEKNIKITTPEDIEIYKSLLHIDKEYWIK